MLKKRGRDDSPQVEKNNTKKQKINEDEDDFQAYGIDDRIADKLKSKSIVSLFEVQKAVFKPIHKGKNVIVASLTGSGKTLSFVLPVVQKAIDDNKLKSKIPFCMVITPTRELSVQVAREFSDLSSGDLNFKTVLIYGGVSIEDQSSII
jgi:ATP-dependent RNA helicase RhlE